MIWPNFKLSQDYIVILVTCKIEEDPIKNEGARVLTSLKDNFFRPSMADNSKVSGGIIIKSLDPLRAKNSFIRKKLGHTMVPAIKTSLVTLWNSAEIRTHPSFYCCPHYLQE